jgi:hypothetical protein
MARSAADKALGAAAALDAYLRERRHRAETAAPKPPAPVVSALDQEPSSSRTDSQPSRNAAALGPTSHAATGAPLCLPQTDWLRHRLAVTGPAADLAAFRQAAAGAGIIPWSLDLESLEEDWFHLLARPDHQELSLPGARILAGQLRGAVEHRHALAIAQVGRSRACPFDLHALVPVPVEILRLGPDHPDGLAWLWQHWGTTEPLRHVAPSKVAPEPLPAGQQALHLTFWSADWTPWRAFQQVGTDWPTLRMDVQPEYAAR